MYTRKAKGAQEAHEFRWVLSDRLGPPVGDCDGLVERPVESLEVLESAVIHEVVELREAHVVFHT